jgi:hypothetical protein
MPPGSSSCDWSRSDREARTLRRLVPVAELASLPIDGDAMESVIDSFGGHRLLSFDRDPDSRGPTIEVAHEALLREWGRLRGWIDGARDDVIMRRRLESEAGEWERAVRDPSFLLRGSRLSQFEAWSEASGLARTADERDYLRESITAREAEVAEEEQRQAKERALERRSIRRLRALVAAMAAAAVIAIALSAVALASAAGLRSAVGWRPPGSWPRRRRQTSRSTPSAACCWPWLRHERQGRTASRSPR